MEAMKHWMGIYYSPLLHAYAEEEKCFWLIDAIASHVVANNKYKNECAKNERFQGLNFWHFDGSVLLCQEDSGMEPVVRQEFEYTDLKEKTTVYCALNDIEGKLYYYLFLPEEY